MSIQESVHCDGQGCMQQLHSCYHPELRQHLPPPPWRNLLSEGSETLHFCSLDCLATWVMGQLSDLPVERIVSRAVCEVDALADEPLPRPVMDVGA